MLTLAVDTSSAVGSVAILRDGRWLGESTTVSTAASPRTKSVTHSTNLVPAIEELAARYSLSAARFDLLAVGLGPGSFTGIRVGIATLKGYALALKKPLVGVPSMDAMALANKDRLPKGCTSLAVLLDAGRGELYASFYSALEGQFFKVNDVSILDWEALQRRILTPTFFIGPQLNSFRDELSKRLAKRAVLDESEVQPSAHFVGLLGEEKFNEQQIGDPEVEPIYLRAAANRGNPRKRKV